MFFVSHNDGQQLFCKESEGVSRLCLRRDRAAQRRGPGKAGSPRPHRPAWGPGKAGSHHPLRPALGRVLGVTATRLGTGTLEPRPQHAPHSLSASLPGRVGTAGTLTVGCTRLPAGLFLCLGKSSEPHLPPQTRGTQLPQSSSGGGAWAQGRWDEEAGGARPLTRGLPLEPGAREPGPTGRSGSTAPSRLTGEARSQSFTSSSETLKINQTSLVLSEFGTQMVPQSSPSLHDKQCGFSFFSHPVGTGSTFCPRRRWVLFPTRRRLGEGEADTEAWSPGVAGGVGNRGDRCSGTSHSGRAEGNLRGDRQGPGRGHLEGGVGFQRRTL